MPARQLTKQQLEDAARLKSALVAAKREYGLTQADLATLCGWDSQSTVSQYATGRIPLNVDALGAMCLHLRVPMNEISPTLARRLAQLVQTLPRDQRGRQVQSAWPFAAVSRAEVDALARDDLLVIERHMAWVIDQARTRSKTPRGS